ncbi:unnamed protein product [Amoebophrya sp. A120]|nr:unnamed protein product [Amoebophrya sp. A120]|eukprot:GSA120T00000821001.1
MARPRVWCRAGPRARANAIPGARSFRTSAARRRLAWLQQAARPIRTLRHRAENFCAVIAISHLLGVSRRGDEPARRLLLRVLRCLLGSVGSRLVGHGDGAVGPGACLGRFIAARPAVPARFWEREPGGRAGRGACLLARPARPCWFGWVALAGPLRLSVCPGTSSDLADKFSGAFQLVFRFLGGTPPGPRGLVLGPAFKPIIACCSDFSHSTPPRGVVSAMPNHETGRTTTRRGGHRLDRLAAAIGYFILVYLRIS